MRYFEIAYGYQVPLSLEDKELVDRISKEGRLYIADMDERDVLLADAMVSRHVLLRKKSNKGFYYSLNSIESIWSSNT